MENKYQLKIIRIWIVRLLFIFCLVVVFCLKCDASDKNNAVQVQKKDGKYTVEVELKGGSGRASIVSPAVMTVKNGYAYVRIQWSSSNYDYMKIGDEMYRPVEGEENSTFDIPITEFDKPVSVSADTTAMSVPHEIEYTFIYLSDSIKTERKNLGIIISAVIVIGLIGVVCICRITRRKIQ